MSAHESARRIWVVALGTAREAGNTDLASYVLHDLALQSLHLDRPDEALHQVRTAQAMSAVGDAPVSPSTRYRLAIDRARAHAARGEAAACQQALGEAEEFAAAVNPATTPIWGSQIVHAGRGDEGVTLYRLAITGADRSAAGRAVQRLRGNVEFGAPFAKLRALYLPALAGAHAQSGDVDTAVTVGHQAVDAVAALSSQRARDELRVLRTVLEPMAGSPGVAELRHRLAVTVA